METICIVDTSLATDNIGDEIIMDSVNEVVRELFPSAFIHRVPSHEALSGRTQRFIYDADWCFIGGTNLISSKLGPFGLWHVNDEDAPMFGSTRTVLLGVGWNDYQPAPNGYTTRFLRKALSPTVRHSVRDQYTQAQLERIGINALSTSCVTTWNLTPEHCAKIPRHKAPAAALTLTAWRSDPEADRLFVSTVLAHYKQVFFFPQQREDLEYFQQLGFGDIRLAATTSAAYSTFLEQEDVDVIGTRLHGGIRALQKGRRTLILAIDNRAAEISKDIGLPVHARSKLDAIKEWIEGGEETLIKLPQDAIAGWKAQFKMENRKAVTKPARAAAPKPDWKRISALQNFLGKAKRTVARP